MKVYPNVDFYILKPKITAKQSKNVRKTLKTTTYTKPKRVLNTET